MKVRRGLWRSYGTTACSEQTKPPSYLRNLWALPHQLLNTATVREVTVSWAALLGLHRAPCHLFSHRDSWHFPCCNSLVLILPFCSTPLGECGSFLTQPPVAVGRLQFFTCLEYSSHWPVCYSGTSDLAISIQAMCLLLSCQVFRHK